MEKHALYVDPRTKLFLLLAMNIVMLNTSSGDFLPYLRFVIGFLPFVLLFTAERYKPAWVYLAMYLISHAVIFYILDYTSGVLMMLLGFLSSMCTKFVPGGMLGVYFFSSTRVNEFVASMERMHISQKVIIPVSVMFRFFPTVKEEVEGISDAMRMRKLGFSYLHLHVFPGTNSHEKYGASIGCTHADKLHGACTLSAASAQSCCHRYSFQTFIKPVEILEYGLVPLMISVVNIGEDLSASALTRCLGYKNSRTNISRCGFGGVDYMLFAVGMAFILLYFLELGGMI